MKYFYIIVFTVIILAFPVIFFAHFYEANFTVDDNFNFLVIGDFGELRPAWNYSELPCKVVSRSMKKFVDSEDISMVLTLGDNIYAESTPGYFKDAVTIFCEIFHEILEKVPFYLSYGNHDYYDNKSRGMILDELNQNLISPEVPSNKIIVMKDFKISLTFLPCDLICHGKFESNTIKNECVKMLAKDDYSVEYLWLENHLKLISEDSSITWKFVIIHYPVFSISTTGMDSENLKTYLLPLLVKYKIDVLLAGHNHNMQYFYHNFTSSNKYQKQSFNKTCMSEASIHCNGYKLHCMRQQDECLDKSKSCQNSWFVEKSRILNKTEIFHFKKGEGIHQVIQGAGGADLDPICPKTESPMAETKFAYSEYGFGFISITRNNLKIKYIRSADLEVVFQSVIES
jgi:predicted phosphodiesterase